MDIGYNRGDRYDLPFKDDTPLIRDLRALVALRRPIKPTVGVLRAVAVAYEAGEELLAVEAENLIADYAALSQ